MEPFILLLASFAVLGVLDIVGGAKIGLNYILIFAAIFISIFLYNINFSIPGFFASSGTIGLFEIFGSIAVIAILPRLGLGDRIFLATTFLVYPFWLMWGIIALAMILTKPIFRLILFFAKDWNPILPFYPFLFLSALIAFFVVSWALGDASLLPIIPPISKLLGF